MKRLMLVLFLLFSIFTLTRSARAEVVSNIQVETTGTDTHVRVEQNIRTRSSTTVNGSTATSVGIIRERVENKIREREEAVDQKREELGEKMASRVADLKNRLAMRVVFVRVIITQVGDNTITVKNEDNEVMVNILEDTRIVRRFFGDSDISELKAGHEITVYGWWTDDTQTAVDAKFIRDLSIQVRYGVFVGTVTSISGNTMVIDTVHRGSQTIDLSGSPALVNREMETITVADIKVGHRVRVKGMWDRSTNTITEVRQVKDYSIPERGMLSPTTQPI